MLSLLVLLMGLLPATAAGADDDDSAQLLGVPGHVLLIRHAEAPGTGDPEDFCLGACSTQRNLSKAGRDQARAVGDWLRNRGIERARVYSSQWCRCLETAELLDLGPVAELPGLNSFFDRPQDRGPNLAALRDFLRSQPPQGELLVLVTHQVTISALTGEYTASGHGVLANLAEGGALRTIRRIDFSGAETDPVPGQLVLGTATPGGGFQLFGQHLAEVINESEPSLRVEAIATRGSLQNLKLLETGKIDIGLVEGNAAHQALEGIGRAPASLAVLSVMYPNPGMFAVLADSPYRNIEDLKGKPVAFGTRASGLRILAHDVLDGIGLAPERDFEPVILDKAGDGPRLVLDGKLEALWGAGIGWPGFLKIAESPAGGRFIAPSAAQVEQILKKHPRLRTMSVPAGTYKGQASPIASVGLWSLILVRPTLSEDIVYRLALAIHNGESALAERLAQGRYTTAQNTAIQVPAVRLHRGTARYYREAGVNR